MVHIISVGIYIMCIYIYIYIHVCTRKRLHRTLLISKQCVFFFYFGMNLINVLKNFNRKFIMCIFSDTRLIIVKFLNDSPNSILNIILNVFVTMFIQTATALVR